MEEELRKIPFECRRCWHVWEEDYVVRHVHSRRGDESLVWLQAGLPVPPPAPGAICPRCGGQQATTFPNGYLAHHPELIPPAGPVAPDPTPLLSPVPKPLY
ncbi:hypothetical protein ABGB18_10370 [Nonomuraea sp. B12E4]|uniref:hypothetical protein n=1 Tax=Nonomuraea sp. B12E4 TaxID=3153564 RepID=UPI00325ECF9D